jgi:hypothetical protein
LKINELLKDFCVLGFGISLAIFFSDKLPKEFWGDSLLYISIVISLFVSLRTGSKK